jgi:hypothetical protein
VYPNQHGSIAACTAAQICTVDIAAVATYSSKPPSLRIEFVIVDPFESNAGAALCPLLRRDIRWTASDWKLNLREALESKLIGKLRKYNKHLAIWQARRLIQRWAKGSVSMGQSTDTMGFLGKDAVKLALEWL